MYLSNQARIRNKGLGAGTETMRPENMQAGRAAVEAKKEAALPPGYANIRIQENQLPAAKARILGGRFDAYA